jgi:hypothetical protein
MFSLFAFLNLAASGLLLGGMMEVVIADIPLFLKLAAQPFVEVHHGIDSRKHPYMPLLSAIAVLGALGELWFRHSGVQIVCGIIGIIGIATVAGISELFNVPLNGRIKTWESDPSVGDISRMRQLWIRGHYSRTTAAALAFCAFLLIAVVFS